MSRTQRHLRARARAYIFSPAARFEPHANNLNLHNQASAPPLVAVRDLESRDRAWQPRCLDASRQAPASRARGVGGAARRRISSHAALAAARLLAEWCRRPAIRARCAPIGSPRRVHAAMLAISRSAQRCGIIQPLPLPKSTVHCTSGQQSGPTSATARPTTRSRADFRRYYINWTQGERVAGIPRPLADWTHRHVNFWYRTTRREVSTIAPAPTSAPAVHLLRMRMVFSRARRCSSSRRCPRKSREPAPRRRRPDPLFATRGSHDRRFTSQAALAPRSHADVRAAWEWPFRHGRMILASRRRDRVPRFFSA